MLAILHHLGYPRGLLAFPLFEAIKDSSTTGGREFAYDSGVVLKKRLWRSSSVEKPRVFFQLHKYYYPSNTGEYKHRY